MLTIESITKERFGILYFLYNDVSVLLRRRSKHYQLIILFDRVEESIHERSIFQNIVFLIEINKGLIQIYDECVLKLTLESG